LIRTQGGSVVSGSDGIQGKASNIFYAKERMLVVILCKKDGQLLCSCSCLLDELKARTKVFVYGIGYEN